MKLKTIDYYYSIRGSFAYLGAARLTAIAQRFGRRVNHRPILLSAIMGPIGAQPFDERPPLRTAYAQRDFMRFAKRLGMQVHADPLHHIGAMALPSGAVVAAQRAVLDGEPGDVDALSEAILAALWRDDRDIADEGVLAEVAAGTGFNAQRIIEAAVTPHVQLEVERNCRDAIVLGVLGSPTYFVDGEPFYGQDRLDFVEAALEETGAQ